MGPFQDGWTAQDVAAVIARGVPDELLYVPIMVSMDPPEFEWSQAICILLASHPHFNVRGNAILGFGHLARTFRRIDAATVVPLIAAALQDESAYVRGHADDAAGDLLHYLNVRVPGHES